MEINPNQGIGVPHMMRGIRGVADIKRVAGDLADTTAPVVQDALDPSVQAQMARDVRTLKLEWAGKHLSLGQMRTALMTAGALLSGPSGVVPYTVAETLHRAVSDRESRQELAEQSVALSQGRGLQGAQYEALGLEVGKALIDRGVAGENVPTALFMSGAVRHHQDDYPPPA